MDAIGVIYPAYLPPYSTVFWHYKQWREQGVIEEIMVVLHGKIRGQAKKAVRPRGGFLRKGTRTKKTTNGQL
jgi:hypothetical protein